MGMKNKAFVPHLAGGGRVLLNTPWQVNKKYPEGGLCREVRDLWSNRVGNREGFGLNFKIYLEMYIHVISYRRVRMRRNRFSFWYREATLKHRTLPDEQPCWFRGFLDPHMKCHGWGMNGA